MECMSPVAWTLQGTQLEAPRLGLGLVLHSKLSIPVVLSVECLCMGLCRMGSSCHWLLLPA